MKDLQNYSMVQRDVGLDSTPRRNESGQYLWSNGQLKILNQPEFNGLSNNGVKIAQLDNSLQDISEEIQAFESPTMILEQEGDGLLAGNRDEIENQQTQLEQFKTSLDQLDKDMLIRGYIPSGNTPLPEFSSTPTPKSRRVKTKEILGFLLIWLIGEIFMTYVQWNSLRDGKGIEDMIVRSFSLGTVLFLIHLVGRYFKRDHRKIHIVFLCFSFLMLFTMLIGPLLLNEAYPPLDANNDISIQWSLGDDTTPAPEEEISPYPLWVNFYRKNDMLPGIFVFLFFVIMQTFAKKQPKEPPTGIPPATPEPTETGIEERRAYYVQQIERIEKRLQELYQVQQQNVSPNTQRLQFILDELQTKQAEMTALKREKDSLLMDNDKHLRKLDMYLNQYQTEYLSVLKNDPVKALVVQPEWPSIEDLKTYFKLS